MRPLKRTTQTREERNYRRQRVIWFATILLWIVTVAAIVATQFRESPVEETPVIAEAEQTLVSTATIYDIPAAEPVPPYLREDIPLDAETQELLYTACGETGIRYELALAVIWRETTFRNVVGDDGNSIGYMQVQPRWHGERMARLGVTDLMDPLGNFRVGCDYLAELLEQYSLTAALTCYNTGAPGHNQYATDVLNYMEELTA